MKRFWIAVVASGMWMNLSEFIRNEFVIKHMWIKGFEEIGLSFPSAPVNDLVWVIWTFIFCAVLTTLNMRFNALKKHNNLLGHWFRATFNRHVEHRNLAEGDLVLGSALEFR